MPGADNAREFVEQVADLWRKRHSFKGLLGLVIVSNASLFGIFGLAAYILAKTEVISTATDYAHFFVVGGLVFGVSNLGLFILWAYWRTLPIASREKIEILFAPSADPEASELVYKLYEKFLADIASRQMAGLMKCRHLPAHISVQNSQDAHSLLARTGARLIVYGLVGKGKVKGDLVEGFRSISFAIRHRGLAPHENISVIRDMAAALAHRTFCAHDANSFIEYDVVVKNLSEVSIFFIALALTLDGRTDDALRLLNPLLADVEAKVLAKANNPQFVAFLEAIKTCVTVALRIQFSKIYDSTLIEHLTDRAYDELARKCDAIMVRLNRLNKRDEAYYLGSAIIRFHFGEIAGAKALVEHAKRLSAFDNPGPHLSMAFLNLWEKEYRQAFMQYMRAGKCKNVSITTITSVLIFLNTALRLNPDRQELRFAIAFVNDRFFDQRVALDDYKLFLATEPKAELAEFRTFAQRQVEKILATECESR